MNKKQTKFERMEQALKVLYVWAAMDLKASPGTQPMLTPQDVKVLAGLALGKEESQ